MSVGDSERYATSTCPCSTAILRFEASAKYFTCTPEFFTGVRPW